MSHALALIIKGLRFSGPGIRLFSIYETAGHWTIVYEQVELFRGARRAFQYTDRRVRVLRS